MQDWRAALAQTRVERKTYLIDKRRTLHRCPEVGFELPKTCALIEQWLDEMGIAHTRRYGQSSIVGMVGTRTDVPVIAVRADMDALPVTEKKRGFPFVLSIRDSCMPADMTRTWRFFSVLRLRSSPMRIRFLFG